MKAVSEGMATAAPDPSVDGAEERLRPDCTVRPSSAGKIRPVGAKVNNAKDKNEKAIPWTMRLP